MTKDSQLQPCGETSDSQFRQRTPDGRADAEVAESGSRPGWTTLCWHCNCGAANMNHVPSHLMLLIRDSDSRVATERERCAKLCETYAEERGDNEDGDAFVIGRRLAGLIRGKADAARTSAPTSQSASGDSDSSTRSELK